MRIIIPMLLIPKSGGMRVLTKLAEAWTDMGAEVEFVVADNSKPYFPIRSDIRITHLNKGTKVRGFWALYKHLVSRFDEFDVMLANQNLTTFPVYWCSKKKKNKKKNYYYIQAYETEFYPGYSLRNIVKRILAEKSYKLPFIKIVNSNTYTEYRLVKTDKVVYPGLDLKLYYSKDITKFNSTIRIGTIGRTQEWKGTSDVCKAMEILKADGIEFDFYIAFNDFDTVPHKFVKPDGDENLSAFYRDMDIVVAACKGQQGAIHYPVIETMAVGTTIVCTDYYPSNDNNAYKVDESSPEQIADAIKKIINNKQEAIRKREQALKDVQQFDWPIVARKFLNYMQEENEFYDNAQ